MISQGLSLVLVKASSATESNQQGRRCLSEETFNDSYRVSRGLSLRQPRLSKASVYRALSA